MKNTFKKYIHGLTFSVSVKPNANKTEFLGFDETRCSLCFAIAASAEKNNANEELLKILKKELGVCKIISGKTNTRKKIKILTSKTF